MLLGAWRLAVSDSRYKKLKMITKYAELADRLIVLKKSWKNLQKTVFFFSPLFGMECLRKEKQKRGLSSRGFFFLEIKSHLSVIFQPPLLQIYLYNKDCKRGGGICAICLLFGFQMGVLRAFM